MRYRCDARIYCLYRTHRGKKHVFTKKEGLKKYNNGILTNEKKKWKQVNKKKGNKSKKKQMEWGIKRNGG
jgi:hypothetical protein